MSYEDWIGKTIKPRAFWVLGSYGPEGQPYLTSWLGDDPVRYAVALGVRPGDPVVFHNLKSGTRLVCCRDREHAIERARELGGVAVLGWFDESRARVSPFPSRVRGSGPSRGSP